jgi:pre-mRNA-splicing factor ATP-dependent RNA helicase DHX15/PRP43
MAKQKIGILDPEGLNLNPLTGEPYSDTYKQLAKVWSTYPVYSHAKQILNSLEENQLTMAVVGTGGGKTALIPKFALHWTDYKGKVAISLPKQNVTLSSAEFAAKTLDVQLGGDIGYVYKGSDRDMYKPANKMVYMTDGLLIMKFVNDPLLSEFNVVIIDEAHERKVQIDLLLLFLKNLLLSGKRPDLKVVIMSATIDADKYLKYFGSNGKITSKIIKIEGQSNHPIDSFFMKNPSKSFMVDGLEVIKGLIDGKSEILDNLDTKIDTRDKGAILFFVTTSSEALRVCRDVRSDHPEVYCVELYRDMDKSLRLYAETRDAYKELGRFDRKIVTATNVAESSITIDGLKYVIDSGYELHSHFDPHYGGSVLETRMITRAQAVQRKGRVGRTEPGICIHLYTRKTYDELRPYPEPDILEEDITIDILKILQTTPNRNYPETRKLLSELMDPPKKVYIDYAYDLQIKYGLLSENQITPLGNLVTLFSSLSLNKTMFMYYAYGLKCAREACAIVAMLELGGDNGIGAFFFKQNQKIKPESIQHFFLKKGDQLSMYKLYDEYKGAADRRSWSDKYAVKLDLMKKAYKNAGSYFHKLDSMFRPSTAGTTDIIENETSQARISGPDLRNNLLKALKQSHEHQIARHLTALYPEKKAHGQISSSSVIPTHYKTRELDSKTFIYDKLTQINGQWKFSGVTIV